MPIDFWVPQSHAGRSTVVNVAPATAPVSLLVVVVVEVVPALVFPPPPEFEFELSFDALTALLLLSLFAALDPSTPPNTAPRMTTTATIAPTIHHSLLLDLEPARGFVAYFSLSPPWASPVLDDWGGYMLLRDASPEDTPNNTLDEVSSRWKQESGVAAFAQSRTPWSQRRVYCARAHARLTRVSFRKVPTSWTRGARRRRGA